MPRQIDHCPKCNADLDHLSANQEEEGWIVECDVCEYAWGTFYSKPEGIRQFRVRGLK